MKDQYGDNVPDDLVYLDVDIKNLSEEEIKRIANACWFEDVRSRWIMVPASEIGEDLAEQCEENVMFRRIDDPLKRWSEEDGFYHA